MGHRTLFVRDMLGSTRAVLKNGTMVEWNDYYAYGAVRVGKSLANGLPTRQFPPFNGGIGVFLSLTYVTKQIAEGINSLIQPRISAPQVMSTDATAVFKPLPGQLQ